VPFELLVEQLNPVRSAAYHPLFQVAMAFQNNVRPELALDGVGVEQLAMSTRTAKFDLDIQLSEVPTENPEAPMAAGMVLYATDLFDRASIERLVTWFGRVIEAVVADASVVVGEVALLDRGERDLVLSDWSGAGVRAPVGVAAQLLAAAVAADADAVAVLDGARVLSYRELDQWSTRLARVLIEAGVGPERAVGVAMDRCVELVVAWWAVVKAGGVYVPVDRAHPVERIATVLDAARAVCVLTCGADTVAGAGARPVLRIDTLDLSGRSADPITDADRLAALALRRGFAAVLSGANADDLGDWRPGLRAAAEHGVLHPLLEASVGKDQVRALARHLGVPSADKPASPCLASRLPYGTPVSGDVLSQVDRAELSLKQRGYRELRVRHFGDLGRVQLGAADLPRAADPDEHAAVLACVLAAGYQRAEIDERPLRSGSLNLDITPVSRAD